MSKSVARDLPAPRRRRRWATETERQVDRGETPSKSRLARLFGHLIDLHIDDICDVGKSPLRSKAAALDMLQRHLGKCSIAALDRERPFVLVVIEPPKVPDR